MFSTETTLIIVVYFITFLLLPQTSFPTNARVCFVLYCKNNTDIETSNHPNELRQIIANV